MPEKTMVVITYPCPNLSYSVLVKLIPVAILHVWFYLAMVVFHKYASSFTNMVKLNIGKKFAKLLSMRWTSIFEVSDV